MENLTLCVPRPSSSQDPHHPVLARTRLPLGLPQNHVLIEVERFGFSANNVTYQALGEAPHFRYFDFHTAPSTGVVSPTTHGLIPVWGFGTIINSTHARIRIGERVYGYLAPTRYLILPVSPSDVNRYSFFVPRPHLPSDRRPYNQITRCQADPQWDPSPLAEDLTMLYRPLFWTAFWCEDWLHAANFRGADSFIISSASAKTAFCLAYLLGKRRRAEHYSFKITGLTSTRNVAFTRGLKLYDEVLEYDGFEASGLLHSSSGRYVYVDVAGNDALNSRIQAHFATSQALVAGVQLGLTNLSPSAPSAASIKFVTNTSLSNSVHEPRGEEVHMEQFFMPEWLAARKRQLSVAQITSMQATAWRELMDDGKDWVRIERIFGGEQVQEAYRRVAKEGTDPTAGAIWSLWDNPGLGRNALSKL